MRTMQSDNQWHADVVIQHIGTDLERDARVLLAAASAIAGVRERPPVVDGEYPPEALDHFHHEGSAEQTAVILHELLVGYVRRWWDPIATGDGLPS